MGPRDIGPTGVASTSERRGSAPERLHATDMTTATARERHVASYRLREPLAYRGTVYKLDRVLEATEAEDTARAIADRRERFREAVLAVIRDIAKDDPMFRLSDERPLVRRGSEEPNTGTDRGPLVTFPKFWFTVGRKEYCGRYSVNVCRGRANSKVWFRAQPAAGENGSKISGARTEQVVSFFSWMDDWARLILPAIGKAYKDVLCERWPEASFAPSFQLRTSAAVSSSEGLASFLRDVRYGLVHSPIDLFQWPQLELDVLVLTRLARLRGPTRDLRPVDGRKLEDDLQWWPVRGEGSAGLYVGQLTREGLDFAGLCAGASDLATPEVTDLQAARRTLRALTSQTAEWF